LQAADRAEAVAPALTICAVPVKGSTLGGSTAANHASRQWATVERCGIFAQNGLNELDRGQKFDVMVEVSHRWTRTGCRHHGHGGREVASIVADDMARASVDRGIPEVGIVGVDERRGRGSGRAVRAFNNTQYGVEPRPHLMGISTDRPRAITSAYPLFGQDAPGFSNNCR
jgi:hypothetical protein